MSDPHLSFGNCKCANCMGMIQMGNVIDLTLDATEVAKMSKLKSTNKGKISYQLIVKLSI